MCLNADQLDNKMSELEFRVRQDKPDLVCVNEVIPKNLRTDLHKEVYELQGFEMHHNLEKYEKVPNIRGSIIYVRSGLNWKPIELKDAPFEECLLAEVKLKGRDNLLCGNMYRRGESTNENNTKFLNTLENISKEKHSHKVIMGDPNLPKVHWDEEEGTVYGYCSSDNPKMYENRFLECIRDCYYFQHVTEPTRQRGSDTPSTLDLILSNEEHMVKNLQYQAPLGKSDHSVLLFDIICEEEKPPPVVKYVYQKGDYDKFNKIMSEFEWEEELTKHNGNVEEQWKVFRDKYYEAEKICVPQKKVFVNGQQVNRLTIKYDRATVLKMKKKTKLWSRKRRQLASEEESLQFNRLRNQISRLTKKSKKLIEKNIAMQAKTNPKAFYKYSQQKLKTRAGIPDLVKPGTEKNPVYISDDKGKAEAYLEYFGSVFTKEPDGDEMPEFEERQYAEALRDIEITPEIVLKKLKKLKKSKSPGPDSMHPRVLNEISASVSLPLSIIFNTSVSTMSLPQQWKHANISAIYKKGKRTLPSNYRPVSLTCIACKVLESIIRDSVIAHMNLNQLFSQKQFGFLSKRSTVLQLIRVLDIWTEILEQGGSLDVIYMDFMKAFDKVPHRRLVYKIEKYGIKGNVLGWINNFLSNRTQCVVLNGARSDTGDVTSGIPQGSVLGPILFVLYINDLPEVVDDLSFVFLFADDTKIFRHIKSIDDVNTLQSDIQSLLEWSDNWLLKFHPDKCIAMNIGKEFMINERSYSMDNTILKKSECEKDIGVHVDNNLNFKKHITACVSKANRILAIIYKTFDYIDVFIFKQIFKSLARPHQEYAAPVWSPHHEHLKTLIENVQRRATKKIPGFSELEYPERLRKLKMPTLAYRRQRGDMIQMFKLIKGFYDPTLPSIFEKNPRQSKGHSEKLNIKGATKDIRKYSFTVRAIKIWKSLPHSAIDAETIVQFESELGKHWQNQETLWQL